MPCLKRILVAEDDPGGAELTLSALGELDLADEVKVVHDGEEALDYLYRRAAFKSRQKGNPALILLDLKMPKVTGTEVLQQIKADEDLRTIPVVVFTSSREEKDLTESYKLGVNAYVVKPVEFREFVEAVTNLGLFWTSLNIPPPEAISH